MMDKKLLGIYIVLFLFCAVQSFAESIQFQEGSFISKPLSGMQRYPAVAYAKGVYLVVWQEGHYGWGFPANTDIMGIRLSNDGKVLDRESFLISGNPDFQEMPAIATNGDIFFVVWQDLKNGKDYDIYGARITVDSRVLDPEGIAVAKANGNQCRPSVSFDGENFIVVWMDNRDFIQSYHIRAARVTTQGVVLDTEGKLIAGFEKAHFANKLRSDNLGGLPLNSFPKIACNNGECLVAWIQKTQDWSEYPRFMYIKTKEDIRLGSDIFSIPKSSVLEDDRAGEPAINLANSGNRYMAVYSGIQGKGGGHYFIAGISFNSKDKSRNGIKPIQIRQWKEGYKLSESIAPYGNGFISVWAEGITKKKESIKFSMKGAIIDKNNNITDFEISPWNNSYRGYPSLSISSRYGLLVYEEINKKDGMRIVGRIFTLE